MKVFTVHEPPDAGSRRLDRIVFVKEGFSWPALFVPMFWLLWHRMWWVLLAWLAIGAGLGVVGEVFESLGFVVGVASVLFAFWFALEANALRRWSLAQKGWRMLDVAAGRDREEAEQSFFRRDSAQPASARPAANSASGRSTPGYYGSAGRARAPVARPAGPGGKEPVIGLFPQPE